MKGRIVLRIREILRAGKPAGVKLWNLKIYPGGLEGSAVRVAERQEVGPTVTDEPVPYLQRLSRPGHPGRA